MYLTGPNVQHRASDTIDGLEIDNVVAAPRGEASPQVELQNLRPLPMIGGRSPEEFLQGHAFNKTTWASPALERNIPSYLNEVSNFNHTLTLPDLSEMRRACTNQDALREL